MTSSSAMKLWELTDEWEQVMLEVYDLDGELTPELEAKLDELDGAWAEKVERVALKIREFEGMAIAAKREQDRLTLMKRAYERTAANLRGYLVAQLERKGQDVVVGTRARVRRQRNPRQTIEWTGAPFDIPEGYRRMKIELDKDAVREDLEAGAEPPAGVSVEWGYHLRIK